MGKSLYDFSKTRDNIEGNSKEKNIKTDQKQKVNFDEENVKKKINQYSKLNEGELMKELQKEVQKQKAEGKFDVNKISSQIENIMPMLDEKQKNNLERILKNLK